MKDSGSDDVLAAIRAVLAGRKYVSSPSHQRAAWRRRRSARKLSPAERCVIKLIADGKSSKEIGDDLNIHYRTVDNHRTNICRKLKLEGVNSLARFALQHRAEL